MRKSYYYSKLHFSGFKRFVTRSVFRELQPTQISLNFNNSCCNLKIRDLGAKCSGWLFYYFSFERSYDVLKSKSSCILLNKNINFNKNKTELKMENPIHSFKEMSLLFQLIRKLKLNLWWVGARKRKKRAFLYRLFCPKGILSICVLSQCTVMNTLSEYAYFYKSKTLRVGFCCSFLKLSKAFSVSLKDF